MKTDNLNRVVIKVVNESPHELPKYQTRQSAGLDLRAHSEHEIELKPLQRRLIGTGLYFELPVGYEAQIRPRSGLANKYGITVLNSPGTIDADYRGEVKVLLVNLSDVPYTISSGDRIAQMIIAKYEQVELKEVPQLADSERASGGFGSTGA